MELYLEQGNKEKERIRRSSELRVEESWQECDHVVFCSTRKQNHKDAQSLAPLQLAPVFSEFCSQRRSNQRTAVVHSFKFGNYSEDS